MPTDASTTEGSRRRARSPQAFARMRSLFAERIVTPLKTTIRKIRTTVTAAEPKAYSPLRTHRGRLQPPQEPERQRDQRLELLIRQRGPRPPYGDPHLAAEPRRATPAAS